MGKLSFLRRSNIALMTVAIATFVSAKAFGGLVEIPIASAPTETVAPAAKNEAKPLASAEPMSEVASVDDAIPATVASASSSPIGSLIFTSVLAPTTTRVIAVVEPSIPPAVAAPLPTALVPGIMLIAASFGLTKKRRLV